jgi:DNA-binding NarL/FixJ family response regulator
VIRVLLADDQPLIRAGFRALLAAEDDLDVVAEAGNGREAIALAERHLPDVALVDVKMPVLDGIEATSRMPAGVRVLILTNYGLDEHVFAALRAGASGFLVKDVEPEELLRGIRVVARGDALLSPAATRALVDEFTARPPEPYPKADPGVLTNREREVVRLVAGGLSNDEIAAHMVISPTTAKTHVSRAMTKLGARDRAQVVVYAYESGLVQPSRERSEGARRRTD